MACGGKWALMVVVFPECVLYRNGSCSFDGAKLSLLCWQRSGLQVLVRSDCLVDVCLDRSAARFSVHVSAPGGDTSKIGKRGIMALCIGGLCIGKLRCLARQGLPTQQLGCTNKP